MLDDDDDMVPLSFVGSATIDIPAERLIGSIRATLGLQLSDLRAARNPDGAFRLLRSHAEQAGVFVLALGDLGSYHTELSVEVFRGFVLTDEFAPFVVINPRDSTAARCFTLLHGLVHLWIGEPGISGGDPLDPVEVFCNNVASSFLLPDGELAALRVPNNQGVEGWAEAIKAFAEPRNVSSSMVAYRLHRRGVINRETWLGLRGLGPALVDLASRLMASGALTTTKVGRVLGVSPRNAHTIREPNGCVLHPRVGHRDAESGGVTSSRLLNGHNRRRPPTRARRLAALARLLTSDSTTAGSGM